MDQAGERSQPIRVVVSGAAGRMGRAAVRAIAATTDLRLVGAVGRSRGVGADAGTVAGLAPLGVPIEASLADVLDRGADVLVEFAPGEAALGHARDALARGVRPVIGATGLPAGAADELRALCAAREVGAVLAPNFALGAVLMMVLAERVARYFPHVEVVELHHDRKRDAPSGTAARTARLVARARGAAPPAPVAEEETVPGARGGTVEGVRVHSVRLPGLVAHQEVIFGGPGQVLTIRHDSLSEESFMPGLLLAVRRVVQERRLVEGLEGLLDL
ncbi:MAG: 4-hydroxy-tetrahydrodipicolinate reductase [Armatimonadota bacterium]|nr:4-hydroxy-tetrahydrodipicolinate reductase [Armatimonadota bacterium]MDR7449725.1 4-hydroxy-tetrahydrodipicolinate reductase [Armatimonadota bacterium]MDR7458719.1 4-hydroxy-tetrahydrodipicolinate reductase [Armatimonadota bacterium]MDR7479328.1 4-hydroxy-tetrahydrodipicolinate reductase [Armatimonadota bacterium]MDR7487926.1 4-hydroxy-tetrahydrodipicolinate reductase [Armatimonadota bacterium]